MTAIAARLAGPWFAKASRPLHRDAAPPSRTGGEPPPIPDDNDDPALDIWGLHDPGRPPATIAILSIAAVVVLGLAAWLQP